MTLSRDPAPPVSPVPQYRVIPDEPSAGRYDVQRCLDNGTTFSLYTANTADREFADLLAASSAAAEGGTFDPDNVEPFS